MPNLHEDLNRFAGELELSPEQREAHVRRMSAYIIANFISFDRAADAVVAARQDELDQVETFVQDEYAQPMSFSPKQVLQFIQKRRAEVNAVAKHEPDSPPAAGE